MDEMKECRKHPEAGIHKNGWCKACKSEYNKKYAAANRDRRRELHKRWRRKNPERLKELLRRTRLKREYGITPERVAEMLLAQENACAICLRRFAGSRKPCVDHCHRTGLVRGLLCRACNVGLGAFGDDPALLSAAAFWLLVVSLKPSNQD